ncbi:hypothetical protein ACFQQB_59300 [Nonomuraea rubra]|uniref:hypothetical protein n=1 Tax=Nonomuraea rubra TaxID=46180 RepID=UPI0036172BE4
MVAVTRPDLEADEYRGGLWLVATDGSAEPRRLTRGPRDAAPAYSPTAPGWPSSAAATA